MPFSPLTAFWIPFSPLGGKESWSHYQFEFFAHDNSTRLALLATEEHCIWVTNIKVMERLDSDNLVHDGGFELMTVELGIPPSQLRVQSASYFVMPGTSVGLWTLLPSSASAIKTKRDRLSSASWSVAIPESCNFEGESVEIIQAISTEPGATYRVYFEVWDRTFESRAEGSKQSNRIFVSFGSTLQRPFVTQGSYPLVYAFNTTSSSTISKIRFTSDPKSCVLIDNVLITRVLDSPNLNLVRNGNFETPEGQLSGESVALPPLPDDWFFEGNRGAILGPTSKLFSAPSGVQVYNMKQQCRYFSAISQKIETYPNQMYTLSFYARAVTSPGRRRHTGAISFASLRLKTFTVEGLNIDGVTPWVMFIFNATASEHETILNFTASAHQCIQLDHIQVFQVISQSRQHLFEGPGYPEYFSTDTVINGNELKNVCTTKNALPAVLTNIYDFQSSESTCTSTCYVGYTRSNSSSAWTWADEETSFSFWKNISQISEYDLYAGISDGTGGLVPLGDGHKSFFGSCMQFRDFDSWSGFWHVEYLEIDGQAYSSNFMMEIAIDGTITTKNCNTSIVTLCGTGYIRLNRVDGINDFYYIEGLSLPSKAVERIKLSENQSMIEFLRVSESSGGFVSEAFGRRLPSCKPLNVMVLDANAIAPNCLQTLAASERYCVATCRSGYHIAQNTSSVLICNSEGEWKGNLTCLDMHDNIATVTAVFASSASTPISNTIDNNLATFWETSPGWPRSSIYFDLGYDTELRRVQIFTQLEAGDSIDDNPMPQAVDIRIDSDIRNSFSQSLGIYYITPTLGWK
eukprot:gene357-3714_t